ncbi:Orotidine 5'-phosphate decarboxylase [hydrothermal vent metagenome]|uniref:Orotidine 5'-phosphate decarboxylase n=1 Tax=hydrothermal vent metagenome TaxID=652676 RepID=A0A3B0Z8W3_9ZZZZ
MSSMLVDDPRVIVALDFPDGQKALQFVEQLPPGSCRLKVGKELFTSAGPDLVRQLVGLGHDVFLDLKFHDIPNTVARACEAAAQLGVWMANVHASGGRRMMEAASAALQEIKGRRPLLIGVTVLTSMGREDLAEIGIQSEPADQVERLAGLAKVSGLDGVVCSPKEAGRLSEALGKDFVLVTPGVRPLGVSTDDQTRVMTPADAISNGSGYLVIGRPVTQADDPVKALETINAEIRGAL